MHAWALASRVYPGPPPFSQAEPTLKRDSSAGPTGAPECFKVPSPVYAMEPRDRKHQGMQSLSVLDLAKIEKESLLASWWTEN